MMNDQALSLRLNMRKLWTDHVVWTRSYVVAATQGSPLSEKLAAIASDVVASIGIAIGGLVSLASTGDAVAIRLLKNQEDIGNAIVPFYGEEAGKKLSALLKTHILIAVNLVEHARKGENEKFEREDKKWKDNAEDIAAFLSSANPNWPKDDVLDLLLQHLKITTNEVVARLQQDWEADIKAYDDLFTEILTLADTLSDGIIKQFPDRFNGMERATATTASVA